MCGYRGMELGTKLLGVGLWRVACVSSHATRHVPLSVSFNFELFALTRSLLCNVVMVNCVSVAI
jgi:hypothetical protein